MKKENRTNDMSKKGYNKPNMRIVKLQHETHLLSGSGRSCTNPNSETNTSSGKSASMWHWQVD